MEIWNNLENRSTSKLYIICWLHPFCTRRLLCFVFFSSDDVVAVVTDFFCISSLCSLSFFSLCVPRFLVFVNRVLAFFAAVAICNLSEQPKHRTPLYKYSFPSMSNVMSSWFQYEALKFVSFPTQVLAKACKVIPVMIMGKFVNGTVYPMVSLLS